MSDIDTAVVDSLKVLDLKWPIREADIAEFVGQRGEVDGIAQRLGAARTGRYRRQIKHGKGGHVALVVPGSDPAFVKRAAGAAPVAGSTLQRHRGWSGQAPAFKPCTRPQFAVSAAYGGGYHRHYL